MSTLALHPSMIERCRRGSRTPERAITAPEPELRLDYIDESVRIAQFDQSRRTRDGVLAPIALPA